MTDAAHEELNPSSQSGAAQHRMRLPGFIADEQIGLGDAIKRATAYLGIPTCAQCEQRSAALNRWMTFTR